jgi:hypothetical protein
MAQFVLPELIEAAARSGKPGRAVDALRRLSAAAAIDGADWAAGLEARSRALMSKGDVAEHCYAEAVERLGRTPLRPELARAHLLYGEWVRPAPRQGHSRVRSTPSGRRQGRARGFPWGEEVTVARGWLVPDARVRGGPATPWTPTMT